MKPFYQRDGIELYHGDCLEMLDELRTRGHAVACDPPYGCANNCDYRRFGGGSFSPGKFSRRNFKPVRGDDRPFDPAPWIGFPKVALCGYQFFAQRLPQGTILIWRKKRPEQIGFLLSDAELIWMKGGRGVWEFTHRWAGCDRESERGRTLHPCQKPVALWKWILQKMRLKPGQTVIDPYAGTAPVGAACIELDLNYIGVEIEKCYCTIARDRLRRWPAKKKSAA